MGLDIFLDYANSDNTEDQIIRGPVTSEDRGATSVRIDEGLSLICCSRTTYSRKMQNDRGEWKGGLFEKFTNNRNKSRQLQR